MLSRVFFAVLCVFLLHTAKSTAQTLPSQSQAESKVIYVDDYISIDEKTRMVTVSGAELPASKTKAYNDLVLNLRQKARARVISRGTNGLTYRWLSGKRDKTVGQVIAEHFAPTGVILRSNPSFAIQQLLLLQRRNKDKPEKPAPKSNTGVVNGSRW